MNKNSLRILGALLIAGAGGGTYWGLSREAPARSQAPVSVMAPKANLSLGVQQHLRSKNWEDLRNDLKDPKIFPLALTEIQNQNRNGRFAPEDQEHVLGLLISFASEGRSPRDWNLLTRCLAAFNLNSSQAKSLRKVIETKSEKRLRHNYLLQAFTGTIPYPADLQKKISQDLLSRDVSQSREALFFLSSLKDQKATETLYVRLLKSYASLSPKMKPLVLKSVFYSRNETLRKDPNYLKAKKDAQNQTGEAWREVQVAFQSE